MRLGVTVQCLRSQVGFALRDLAQEKRNSGSTPLTMVSGGFLLSVET